MGKDTFAVLPENRLRRVADDPRWMMWICFGLIIACAWGYLFVISPAQAVDGFAADLIRTMCAVDGSPWSVSRLFAAALMWLAMILAMMLPTAAPMVSTYLDISEAAREKSMTLVSPWVLITGYICAWLGFAAIAIAIQAWLVSRQLVGLDEAIIDPRLAGAVLIIAGIYQFTPVKHACLTKCARPMPYFLQNWKDTVRGVFTIGLKQGAWCLGCCWALMAVMFVTGLMNLFWMAVIGIVMILEKTLREPRPWVFGVGGVLILSGVAVLFQLGV